MTAIKETVVHWCIEGSDLGSNIHIRKVDAPPWLGGSLLVEGLHARQFCGNGELNPNHTHPLKRR